MSPWLFQKYEQSGGTGVLTCAETDSSITVLAVSKLETENLS
jgi:hypothetical protein